MKKVLKFIPPMLVIVMVILAACSGATPTPTPKQTAVKLVFADLPSEATAGEPFNPPLSVMAQDAQGNVVPAFKSVVTIEIGSSPEGARVFGSNKVALVNGVARFRDFYLDRAGEGYTLKASVNNLPAATSAPFAVVPGAPAQLAFSVQPSGGTAGKPFTKQPEVIVQDKEGNPVASYDGEVTLGITFASGPASGILSGTTTVRVSGNTARFTDVSLNRSNPEFTLKAMSGSLTPATSARFEITHSTAANLEFTVPVEFAKAGQPFEGQPKVAVMDVYGNVVTSARVPITLSLTPGTGAAGANLSGNVTMQSEGGLGGLAEYEDLMIDKAGSGYTLTATSSGLEPGSSQPFNVAP